MLGRKRAVKEQQEESSKKLKVEEVEEDDEVELKKLLVIKKDKDIAIDAIPLATKLPDDTRIDREDLEALWRIVKESTDIANITRKETKTEQKRTWEWKEYTRAENYQALVNKSQPWFYSIMEVTDQAKEIKHLKAQIKKLKKKAKPVITHHKAWIKRRKSDKAKPTVHKDPTFDELDDDENDYMETEDAQDVGRTKYVVYEEKESVEKEVSTKDALSTAQPKVSTDKPEVSTKRPDEDTDKQKVSTDKEEVSTDRPDEGTVDQNEGRSATQTTPTTTTPTIFGDDKTIAQVLIIMSQNKEKLKEKEKKEYSLRIGNMKMKRNLSSLLGIEEVVRKVLRGLEAGRRNLLKGWETNYCEWNKDPEKKKLKKRVVNEEDTAKVPAEQEVTKQGTKKRKSGHVKMIARKRLRPQPDNDSDDEYRKCLRIITFESTIDSEIMETKLFISRVHKVSSPDGNYHVVYRVNGHFRAFNYLMENNKQEWEIVRWRLYEACRVCILEFKDGTVIYMLVERRSSYKGFDAGRFPILVSKNYYCQENVNAVKRTDGHQKCNVLISYHLRHSCGEGVVLLIKVGDEAVHKELGDRMERTATTASSLEAKQDSVTSKQSIDPPLSRGYTLGSGEDGMKLLELMEFCTQLSYKNRKSSCFISSAMLKFIMELVLKLVLYVSWVSTVNGATAKVQTVNGVRQLQALVDKKRVIVTESSIRSDLHLNDAEGTDCLPTANIFEELVCMGAKSTAWNEFSSSMTSLIICLAKLQSEVIICEDSDHLTYSTPIPIIDQPSLSSQPKKDKPSKKAQRQEAEGRSIEDIDANVDVSLVDETQERQNDDLMFDSRVLEDDVMRVEAKVDGKDDQSKKLDDSTTGIDDNTADEAVTTVGIGDSVVPTTNEEITFAQTLMQIKAAKPKVVTTAATTATATRPKDIGAQKLSRKQEEEANIALIKSWENTQAMIEADRLLAERLQSKEREELTDEEKAKLFMELMGYGGIGKQRKERRKVERNTSGSRKKMLGGKGRKNSRMNPQRTKSKGRTSSQRKLMKNELKNLLVIKKGEDIAIGMIVGSLNELQGFLRLLLLSAAGEKITTADYNCLKTFYCQEDKDGLLR
ncbi:hypothetical protein Tco_0015095 [Tanacetum coccineum]